MVCVLLLGQSGWLCLCGDIRQVVGVCFVFSAVLVVVGICVLSVVWCSLCLLTGMGCGILALAFEWSGVACQSGEWNLMVEIGKEMVVAICVDPGTGRAVLVSLGWSIGSCLWVSSTARWHRCIGCAPTGP